MKYVQTLSAWILVMSLGACASSPFRSSRLPEPPADPIVINETSGEGSSTISSSPSKTVPGTASAKPPASVSRQDSPGPTSRRGAYYMDDGPGSEPAPDHRTIPNAQPKREPLLTRANRPYVVFGRNYQPMTALVPYRQRGFASWYGRKFHGQKTASGEVYNMYSMTAAHPTLPIPSYVKVTNTRNGEQVVVRVNDRGPFLNDRLIDLSFTAAAKLGYVNAGSAEVEVELIAFQDTESGNNTLALAQGAVNAGKLANVTTIADATTLSGSTPTVSTPGAPLNPSVPVTPGVPVTSGVSVTSGATLIPVATLAPGAAPAPTPVPAGVRKEEIREERLQVEITVKPDDSPGVNTRSGTSSTSSTSSTAPNSVAGIGVGSSPNASSTAAVPANVIVPGLASTATRSSQPTVAAPDSVPADRILPSRNPARTYLQLGAFTAVESAESVRSKVRKDLEWIKQPIEIVNEAGLFKLRTGPFANREDANTVAERIRVATGSRPFTTTR